MNIVADLTSVVSMGQEPIETTLVAAGPFRTHSYPAAVDVRPLREGRGFSRLEGVDLDAVAVGVGDLHANRAVFLPLQLGHARRPESLARREHLVGGRKAEAEVVAAGEVLGRRAGPERQQRPVLVTEGFRRCSSSWTRCVSPKCSA